MEGSNIDISEDIHQVDSSVQEVQFQIDSISCLSDKGSNSTFHIDGSVSAEEPETNCNMKDICSDYGTEANVNRDTELSQVMNDDSVANLATSKRDELELNNGVLLKDCFLNTDQEGSKIEISDDIYQVHISEEGVETKTDSDSCLSSKGKISTSRTDGSISGEVPETKCDMEGICSLYSTEGTINRSDEFAHVVHDDMIANMEKSKGDDIDWNNVVLLKDSFLKRDQGGSNIEISGDICQVHNCVEEVEFVTDFILCLPSNGSNAAHRIDDSVSAEESESKCSAEVIYSNCGTEATNNKNIEFLEGMNDVSIVNLATSERDDMDLNNSVPLNDNFLNTDRGGSNIERSGDINQVHTHSSVLVPQSMDVSNHSRTSFLELSDDDVDHLLYLSFSLQGPQESQLFNGHETVDIGCQSATSVSSNNDTEAAVNREVELTQEESDDSAVNLAVSERDDMDLSNCAPLKDIILNIHQDGINIEISEDIHEVHSSRVQEVELQIGSISCLSDKGNNSTVQTDGSVPAEEPETNCNMEGVCSDYVTEADTNRDTELSQELNDDSMVNLATSKRDELELNDGVLLTDCFLNTDQEGSNVEISDDIHQVRFSVEGVETQTDGSVSAEVPETKCDTEGICSIYGIEGTINRSTEFAQEVNDASIVNMETSTRDDIDWNNGVILNDSFLKIDRCGSKIEISGNIHHVDSSVEEVEFVTDFILCLPSNGSNAAHRIDDSVSAEEPESKCNMEGICSDCGTEATINRNIEFSQYMNDDSIVNLATSERDDMDINNGVPLDSLLKTDTGGSNIEISGDIHQVNSSVEEVEFQTNSVSCLSRKGNNATNQTDSSVFGEEYENKCNTEDIRSFEVNANLERTDKPNVSIPPPHAVPFSEEWLAAIESAGEEILTKKTGAVQNSPTEKSVPEPSPWSPVKRKTAQMIGPFDCTKHTHIQPDQSE